MPRTLYTMLIALAMLALSGCQKAPADSDGAAADVPPDDSALTLQAADYQKIALDARTQYDALAPSLLATAERVIDDARRRGQLYRGQPSIACKVGSAGSVPFVQADGTTAYLEEITYVVQAVERVAEYEVVGIEEIARTDSVSHPFLGRVRVAVITRQRQSQELKHTVRQVSRTPFASADEDYLVFEPPQLTRRSAHALPQMAPRQTARTSLPRELRPLLDQLSGQCMAATPDARVQRHEMAFRWSVADRQWVPVHPAANGG